MPRTKKTTKTEKVEKQNFKVEDYGEGEKKITFDDGAIEIMSEEDFKSSIYSK